MKRLLSMAMIMLLVGCRPKVNRSDVHGTAGLSLDGAVGITGTGNSTMDGVTIGATTPKPVTATNLRANGAISVTGTQTNGSDRISHVSVNGVLNALDFAGSDIGAKVNRAATQLGTVGGTVFIPAGIYIFTTPIALTKNTCNVTVAGDSKGGTFLVPNFSNGDAISFVDSASENPPVCTGGVRDFSFTTSFASPPTNLNLIHLSNVTGIDLINIYAINFDGIGDTTIYIDTGKGPAGTTFTERIHMRNIISDYSHYMLTLDGRGTSGTSLNNNILTEAHCDTDWKTGSACVHIVNQVSGSILMGNRFQFDGNINAAGASAVSLDSASNGGALNGSDWNFDVQSVAGSYCFSSAAASAIPIAPRGSGFCLNGNKNVVPYWQDKARVLSVFIPTLSGVRAGTVYGGYAPSYYHKTAVLLSLQAYATVPGAACTTAPVVDLKCNGTDQTVMSLTLANGVQYTSSTPATPIECQNSAAIGVVVSTAASGCRTYPQSVNFALEMAEGMPNL